MAQDAKMQEAAGLIKWVVGAGLIAATVMVTVMALVFSSAMPKPQQPLIIITIPMPAQAVNAQ